MKKQSSTLSAALEQLAMMGGVGAASHLGLNALYGGARALSHWAPKQPAVAKLVAPVQRALHNHEARSFARGVQQQVAGVPRGPGQRLVETLAGPEAFAGRESGRLFGQALQRVPVQDRYAYMNQLRGSLGDLERVNPAIARTPQLSELGRGLDETMKKVLPVPGPMRPETRLAKVTPALVTAGLAAVDPPAAIHGVINAVRAKLPHTAMGRQFMKEEARLGRERGMDVGRVVNLPLGERLAERAHEFRNRAVDTALSPMARDPGRVTETLTRSSRLYPKETAAFTQALSSGPAPVPIDYNSGYQYRRHLNDF